MARGRLESREAYIPVLFISIASISSPPTPRRVTAATKSSNDLNADDGPHSASRSMYAMFESSDAPVAEQYTTRARQRRCSSSTA